MVLLKASAPGAALRQVNVGFAHNLLDLDQSLLSTPW